MKKESSAQSLNANPLNCVDQNYTVADAAKAMDVGLSTMARWVKLLRDELRDKTPKASPMTPEQIEIRELRKNFLTHQVLLNLAAAHPIKKHL